MIRVIYIDEILLLNFIIDFILIDFTSDVLKINVKVSENSDIIFNPEKYLKKYEFKYRVSNYNSDESLSSFFHFLIKCTNF